MKTISILYIWLTICFWNISWKDIRLTFDPSKIIILSPILFYDSILACESFVNFRESFAVNTKRGRWYDKVRQPSAYIPAISSFHPSSPLLRALSHSLLHRPEGPISSSFSPSGPSRSLCSLYTASRLLLLLLALLFLFLLLRVLLPPPPPPPPPSLRSPLLSLSLRQRSVPLCPEIHSSFFSLLLLACPSPLPPSWSSCSFCFGRVNENDDERTRVRKRNAQRE